MATFSSKGFNISYEHFSGITNNNILFIHGNLASKEWWHPSIEILKSQGLSQNYPGQVLSADWRGYGNSKGLTTKSEINFDTFAGDYIALAENLNLKNIDLVGHSTGGLIAMKMILKKPELFRSCVLLDSVGPKGIQLELPLEQVLAHFTQMSINKDYCTQVLAATIQNVDSNSSLFQTFLEKAWQCDKIMWTGVIEELCTRTDISSEVSNIKLPVFILHGEKDMVLPLKGAELTHSLLSNSQLKVLPGHGHSYNIEDPQAFVSDLQTFWRSLV